MLTILLMLARLAYAQEERDVVMIVGQPPSSTQTQGQWLSLVPPPAPTAVAAFQQDDKDIWLSAHNAARSQHAAPALQWRDDLEARARSNAELCTGDHS